MKTRNLLKSVFGMAVIALLPLVSSCDAANNPSALAGRWVLVEGPTSGNPEELELLTDGTGVCDNRGGAIWKVENNRFYLTPPALYRYNAASWNYKVSGSTLTLTDDGVTILKYQKCGNKSCQEVAKEYAEAKKAAAIAAFKSAVSNAGKSSFTDSRDGKSYKTVKLNKQTWMAENLNYNANGSKCYGNQENNCQKYGRLYDWNTAKTACPKGWHLPSDEEWQALEDLAVGGDEGAGSILKASSGWADNGNGTDAFGFSALPGGRGYSGGSFDYVGYRGGWWSSTEYGASGAYGRGMGSSLAGVVRGTGDKTFLCSVRCSQD